MTPRLRRAAGLSWRSIPRIGVTVAALVAIMGCVLMQPSCVRRGAAARDVMPDALRAHVVFLSQTCHPRSYLNVTNLNRAADYVADRFRQADGAVSTQEFSAANGRVYRNVCGAWGPGKGPRVVVGAHYDACADTPGADDNASGVAGLMELAGLLQRKPPSGLVELVAYSLEEPPFFATPQMGSARHAHALKQAGTPVRAMLALEMIGYFSDARGSQKYPMPILRMLYPGRGNFIGVIGSTGQRRLVAGVKADMKRATDLPVYSISAPRFLPGVDYSDHRSYWDCGFDAVMITDTAFYRHPSYHGADDTADRLDYDRMAEVVAAVDAAVRGLCSE